MAVALHRNRWLKIGAALTLCLMASLSQAALVLSGTRVLYPADQREVTLKLTNEGNGPILVQAWIDEGDPNATPDQVKVPFTLAPPLFRLDPKKGQAVRIIYTQEPLAQDKESLFWLNALEVPPRSADSDGDASRLQLAIRSRIKLFFRPAGLSGRANDAPEKILWSFARKSDGGYALKASNPTPYHVTFSKVSVQSGGKNYVNEDGAMVAPGAAVQLDIGSLSAVDTDIPAVVHYSTINDYGTAVPGEFHGDAKK
ncbi:MAG: fimbria/pilus periplasmic chaperone [Ottowia sp.]|uniref:fimbria/pilus periplasmic chaperone n=1 Tax=Ottowia sp. TaxID=1898956 RepID=UPI003C723F97